MALAPGRPWRLHSELLAVVRPLRFISIRQAVKLRQEIADGLPVTSEAASMRSPNTERISLCLNQFWDIGLDENRDKCDMIDM